MWSLQNAMPTQCLCLQNAMLSECYAFRTICPHSAMLRGSCVVRKLNIQSFMSSGCYVLIDPYLQKATPSESYVYRESNASVKICVHRATLAQCYVYRAVFWTLCVRLSVANKKKNKLRNLLLKSAMFSESRVSRELCFQRAILSEC